MLRGSEELIELCKTRSTPSSFIPTLLAHCRGKRSECQGACVNAPMVMIFKDAYEDLTPERLKRIIDAFDSRQRRYSEARPADRAHLFRAGQRIERGLTDEAAVTGKEQKEARGRRRTRVTPNRVAPSRAAKPRNLGDRNGSDHQVARRPKRPPRNGEGSAESIAPAIDQDAADRAEPTVEGDAQPAQAWPTARQVHRPRPRGRKSGKERTKAEPRDA